MTWLAILGALTASACGAEANEAVQILESSGIKGGLIVHLGCGRGESTAALRANEACVVHGLSREADDIETARRYIDSLGLHGPVSVDRLRGDRLPYVDNLVNLIVIRDTRHGIRGEELKRVLAPRGRIIAPEGTPLPHRERFCHVHKTCPF